MSKKYRVCVPSGWNSKDWEDLNWTEEDFMAYESDSVGRGRGLYLEARNIAEELANFEFYVEEYTEDDE